MPIKDIEKPTVRVIVDLWTEGSSLRVKPKAQGQGSSSSLQLRTRCWSLRHKFKAQALGNLIIKFQKYDLIISYNLIWYNLIRI